MLQAVEVLIDGLVVGAIYALIATGFTLVYRVAGVLNLSQGAFVVIGALVFYSLERDASLPVPVALAGAVAVAGVAGALAAVLVLRRGLRRLSLAGLLILTVGLLTALEGITLLVWGSQPYAVPPFTGGGTLAIGEVRVPTQAAWVAVATVAVVAGLWLVLARTTFGKALRACGENPVAASLMGIDVGWMTVVAFTGAAMIGALGGAVVGPLTSLEFDTGRFFTNAGFIAVALGGMGSFLGALTGGLSLGVVEQLASGYISSLFSPTIVFVLLLVGLLFRPNGLLGGRARRVDVPETYQRAIPVIRFRGRRGIAIVAVLVLLVAVAPLLLDGTGLVAAFVIAGVYAIAVLGLDVLMGYAGQVSLGHAAFMAVGGYTTGLLVTRNGVPPIVAVLAGLALTLVVALVVSLVTERLRGLYLALATLAVGLLVDSLLVGAPEVTGGPSGLTGIPAFSIGSFAVTGDVANYYLVWGVAGLVAVALANLARSEFGRALQAIRADQTAARALGIPVARYKRSALLLSAACASLAGSLFAFDFRYLAPELVSTPRSLEMVTMLVLGGQGTLVGPVLGATALTLLPAVVQPLATYKTLFEGVLLIAVLLYVPDGLAGAVSWITRRGGSR
ncbi:MAG TPA: ABC transporter permease [Candidatus Limnocylindria bacterium]